MLLCQLSDAQFDFSGDSNYKPFLHRTVKKIDRVYHLGHNNDFELRIWTIQDVMTNYSLFFLAYKDGAWNARFFENSGASGFPFVEKIIKLKNAEELWNELIEYDIINIPKSSELKDSSGKEARILTTDGTFYLFDLLTKNNKRRYSYHCPESHAKEYGYIQEFVRVVNIIKLIDDYCGKSGEDVLCKLSTLCPQTVN
jgi:hypothetical protein